MRREVEVHEDPDALSLAAARLVAGAARDAAAARGRFLWVLSGGHTPRRLYERLAAGEGGPIPWPAVHLIWGDERCVSPSDPDSNYRMAFDALVAKVPIPSGNVHRVPTEVQPRESAARAYDAELRGLAGAPPAFDLALLGLGADGHTASLFPGSPALSEAERWVVPSDAPEGVTPRRRLTLTLPALALARDVVFLVSGAGKAPAVRSVLQAGPGERPPAARVAAAGRVLWLLDRAAAGGP